MNVVSLMVVKSKRDLSDVADALAAITIHCKHEGDELAERNPHLIIAEGHEGKDERVLLSNFVQQYALCILVAELLVEQARRHHLEEDNVQEDEEDEDCVDTRLIANCE